MDDNERKIIVRVIDAILDYAEENKSFDSGFVKSVESQLNMKGFLSERQIAALFKIADKFEIDY